MDDDKKLMKACAQALRSGPIDFVVEEDRSVTLDKRDLKRFMKKIKRIGREIEGKYNEW